MVVERIEYQAGNAACNGALVYDEKVSGRRPLLLMVPNWLGVTDDCHQARGDRWRATNMWPSSPTCMAAARSQPARRNPQTLANGLRADAPERRARIGGALDALRAESDKRKIGDLKRQAAIGFCFGGGNVLELARTGADIQAVICLHGDLLTPLPAKPGDIKAAVCVLHGSQDPVVPKKDRDIFEAEMEASGAKWQMLVFGGLLHSFCEIESDVPGIARYDAGAARQAFNMIDDFATAAFAGKL